MSALTDGGISIDLPAGWDGQIRAAGQGAPAPALEAADAGPAAGEGLVLHAASFPLPARRGDFGSGAVEVMSGSDVLVCLLEHERAAAGTRLFRAEGIPTIESSMFSPQTMQRALPGRAGAQQFFQVSGRPFCLYVVVGTWRTRGPLVQAAGEVVSSLRIDP